MDLVAAVPSDLADLLPAYRRNRLRDVEALRDAISQGSLKDVVEIAERMYAVGNPYGFRQITTFGRQMRDACDAGDMDLLAAITKQYEVYLRDVSVQVVKAPPARARWSPEQRAVAAAKAQLESARDAQPD